MHDCQLIGSCTIGEYFIGRVTGSNFTYSEKPFDQLDARSYRFVLSGFPALHRALVQPEQIRHLFLRHPQHFSHRSEPFNERVGLWKGVVSQKVQDGWNVLYLRGGCVAFPVGNCLFTNADLGGNLLLEEFEV